MQPNRYIHLSAEEVATLEEGAKHHLKAHFRTRCGTLLLSNRGYKVVDIAQLFQVRPHTIRFWMDNWEQKGLVGLMIRSGRGRKAALPLSNPALVEDLQAQIRLNPQSLEEVALAMSKKWHCSLSKGQLHGAARRRFIKKSSVTAGDASVSV